MRTILCFVFLTVLTLQPLKLIAEPTNPASASVVLDFDKAGVRYKVNSKPVHSQNILQALGEILKQNGREAPIVVLMDQRNSLAALSNIRGIVNKAGFLNVRYFCFTTDHEMMEEIMIGQQPAIPFSLNPAPPKLPLQRRHQ